MKQPPLSSDNSAQLAVFIGMFALGAVVVVTQRLELLAISALPLALIMLKNYRVAVVITTWVLLIYVTRLPVSLFDFVNFSYIVYISIGTALLSFLARAVSSEKRVAPNNIWTIGLMVVPVALASIRGLGHVNEIPDRMLSSWTDVSFDARAYLRTFFFTPMLQPLLAVLIARAVALGLNPVRLLKPGLILVWVFGILVITNLVVTGFGLIQLAHVAETSRAEYLYDIGLHANAYGLLCAMAYAFMLAMVTRIKPRSAKMIVVATMAVAALVIFLTFSRSAVFAFGIVNLLYFWNTDSRNKWFVVIGAFLGWSVLPSELFDRFRLGLDSADADVFSSGRLEHIWLPLLPDIIENLLIGQGHYSIYWTQAQQLSQIYPVVHSHNAMLDLLLDYGILGAVPILVFYAYIWQQFLFLSQNDTEPVLRGFFHGGHLAMVVMLLSTLNGRLTPEPIHIFLWVAIGIMFGRLGLQKKRPSGSAHSVICSDPHTELKTPI